MQDLPKQRKRIEELDILKALAIICMVAGHSSVLFIRFIYLFHMAVFFIASGFFYKDKNSDSIKSVKEYVIKKIKQLWFPFFVWASIFTLLHNFFIKINVYTDNPQLLDWVSGTFVSTTAPYSIKEIIVNIIKGALFSCPEQMFGASWFLRVLFLLSVCYILVDFLAKLIFKGHTFFVHLIVSAVLLAIGFFCSVREISAMGLERVASCYWLYFLGYLLGKYKDKYSDWNWKQFLPLFVFSLCFLLWLNTIGTITLNTNNYENPVYLFATSVSGWVFLYSLSYFLKQIPVIKKMMIGIGKRTLTVVILHFLSLKIVEVIVVIYYDMPMFCLATFPNLYGSKGLWWLLYTVVGVSVPVLANILYHKVVDKVLIKNKK